MTDRITAMKRAKSTRPSAKKQRTDKVPRFLSSSFFWIPFIITILIAGLFFAWELGVFINILPSVARPSILLSEFLFTATLSLLLAFDIGLIVWHKKFGACPRGVKRASGLATALGALTLICPACFLLPASFIGIGTILSLMSTHMPALRILSIALLLITAGMLWPRRE